MFKIIIGIAAAVLLLGAIALHPGSPKVEANSPPAAVKGDRLDIIRQRSQPESRPRVVRVAWAARPAMS